VLSMQGKKPPKYSNFDQIFTFWGVLVPIPFTNPGQIWQETVHQRSMLTCQISFNLPGPKNSNFGQMLTFWGLLYLALINRSEPNIACKHRPPPSTMLMCKTSSQLVYSVTLEGWKDQILPFFGIGILWCCQLAVYRESRTCMHNYKSSPMQQ